MRKNYSVIFAGLLIVVLASCSDPLKGGIDGTGEEIPRGMGLARIRINVGGSAQNIRTAVPDISNYFFTLDFTASGETPVSETLDGSDTLTVSLAPVTWNLVVKGYPDSSNTTPGDLLVSGTISLSITAGTPKNFDVFVTPNFSSGATGSLVYAISFPATVDSAILGLYPTDDTPGTSHEIDLILDGASASRALSEGVYRVVIDLYDSTTQEAASRSEVAHIYEGLSTPLTRTFAASDFAACPTVIDDSNSLTTLAAKLEAALGSPAGTYTIVLDGSETDLVNFSPKTLSVTGSKNTTIILRGNGKTVQLDSTKNGSLLTLGATSGSSMVILELRDITLRGHSSNAASLVRVNARGTLNMKARSRITGNSDGGVLSSGTFTMSGGAVTDNSSSSSSFYGGGVFVNSGTFAMSGGAVTNNTALYGGGGVYVAGGTFNMSGGAVSGNSSSSSSSSGGGVYVSNGTFAMSGGAVTGNSSSSYGGGGVYVNSGTFAMSGGAVTGNSSSSGGGVYVSNGTFAMSGGAVHSNILSSTNAYGREALVNGGTFKMSGEARPERVFLYNNAQSITISGPLSGPVTPIDLGITSSVPLTGYVNAPILKLDAAYSSGNLAELKAFFALGNSKFMNSSYTETAITGYEISDNGQFVVTVTE
jgi:hypothetical protein